MTGQKSTAKQSYKIDTMKHATWQPGIQIKYRLYQTSKRFCQLSKLYRFDYNLFQFFVMMNMIDNEDGCLSKTVCS